MNEQRDVFEKVFRTLKSMYQEWASKGTGRSEVDTAVREAINKEKQKMDTELAVLGKIRGKLNSYMNIAKGNASECVPASNPSTYDEKEIAALGLKAASGDKTAASMLYTKADAMLKGLGVKENDIRSAFALRCRTIRRETIVFDEKTNTERKQVEDRILRFLDSQDFYRLGSFLKDPLKNTSTKAFWKLGTGFEKLELPPAARLKAEQMLGDAFSKTDSILRAPYWIDPKGGECVFIEYRSDKENLVLEGLQSIVFQTLQYFADEFDGIWFFDPIRYNATALGPMAELAVDKESLIRHVPGNKDAVDLQIKALHNELNSREGLAIGPRTRRLLIFHSFPENYDSRTALQIRELCVNAAYYGLTILMTHSIADHEMFGDVTGYIKNLAVNVGVSEKTVIDSLSGSGRSVFDFTDAPKSLNRKLIDRIKSRKGTIYLSNEYGERIGFDVLQYRKGSRSLCDIPYGIDEKTGKILTLNFENSDFATFICGASRSGKSTLLHTILTGVIRQNHPDDVEIWLIDFKMTEFSRYIKHTPPHIRYILLDESKELVYDIIDRLTEILRKRQNIFKGKWQKLSEVPKEKYMPAMLIIIDEFSVMSEVLADSVMNASDNYSQKLQTLLAKGAALGMHFIFSSQGFTSGTRGLNDFSKKQIQQRIAMKTELSEIRETLDLRTVSDADRRTMEELAVHHTLLRIPENASGSRLVQAKVLYLEDNVKQEKMIDEQICQRVTAKPRYDVNDQEAYIDKQTLIIDGNSYAAFRERKEQMLRAIRKDEEVSYGEKILVYPGEPRRMIPLYPIEIRDGYCENILFLGSLKDKDALISGILSMKGSADLQRCGMELWSSDKNALQKKMQSDCDYVFLHIHKGLTEVCTRIKALKEKIQTENVPIGGHTLILILGLERMIQEMTFMQTGESSVTGQTKYAPLRENELDALQMIELADKGEPVPEYAEPEADDNSEQENTAAAGQYDAREDLRYILTQGPRLGYHFITVFHTCMEFNRCKLNSDLFRHKLMLRMPRMDAAEIVGSGQASEIAELADHIMRYTNGLEQISFRPYLHKGISFDGWYLAGNVVESKVVEEEEYLL